MRHNHARHIISAVSLAALCGGCSSSLNPFAASDADYAKRTALSRLREVDAATVDRYRTPAPTADQKPAPASQQAEELKQRIASLESITLPIEEARASALINNLDLKVAVIDPAIAREVVSEEEARFESVFNFQTAFNNSDTPTSSTLSSNQSTFWNAEPGVTIPTRTGGSVTLSLPYTRSETDNSFSTLSPAYTQDAEVSISHALLRNAGRRTATAALRIAGYEEQISSARTKLEVIRQIANADRAYWDLYQARQNLDVTQQQFDVAQAQLDRAQRRVQAGLESDVEVIRAEAGVAARLEAIVVAQNNVLLRQREFKRVINRPGLSVDTPTMVVPGTLPDPVQYQFKTDELIAQALNERMDLLELELRLAADAVRQGFDRNQLLPLVDLTYRYRLNGLGVRRATPLIN